MASRLFLILTVLISTFGVECSDEILANIISEKAMSKPNYIGVEIFFGEPNPEKILKTITNKRSSYSCPKIDTGLKIIFDVSKANEWSVRLNTFIDSEKFKPYQISQQARLISVAGKENCFVYGTWWNSEAKSLQFYLNFLTKIASIELSMAVFLNFVVEANKVNSILTIAQSKDLADLQQAKVNRLKYEASKEKEKSNFLKRAFGSCLGGCFGIKKDKKYTINRLKDTQTLINQCNDNKKVCIGNLQCDIKAGSVFNLELYGEKTEMSGDGDFSMMFLRGETQFLDREHSALNFPDLGPSTKTLKTKYANVKCEAGGIKFTLHNPEKRLRLLSNPKILV